jgi:hypothetical protein
MKEPSEPNPARAPMRVRRVMPSPEGPLQARPLKLGVDSWNERSNLLSSSELDVP